MIETQAQTINARHLDRDGDNHRVVLYINTENQPGVIPAKVTMTPTQWLDLIAPELAAERQRIADELEEDEGIASDLLRQNLKAQDKALRDYFNAIRKSLGVRRRKPSTGTPTEEQPTPGTTEQEPLQTEPQ